MARIALAIIILHLGVIGYGWYYHGQGDVFYDNLFYGAFLHVSPVMIVFNVIALTGADYGGHFSALFVVGLVLAFVKYGFLILALRRDGFTGASFMAAVLEVGYVASSGYYLTQLNMI
jgi:hypothetical protein